uniref:Uncharacterized protein n=1 Tax=Panagrolaimus sp. ES5 TaxID=591445 RepID=A0AC34FRU2_9BILA
MRDKVLKKTETKAKKDGKNNKNNETEEDGFIRDKNGEILCCIPMVPCNKKGHPLPESLEDGGVKLCCTNNCAYSKHLVHPECFESLEQGLITMLSNQKTGKKGLIKAWLESQNEQLFDPLCDKKDKKFKLKANLPALTVAVKKGAAPPPDFHELDTHYISSHSPPPSKKIDDKYGPPPETKARKPSIDDTVVSKPPLAKKISVEFASIKPSIAKPVEKPVKKVPVEYAPIEPTDFPKLVEDSPKLRQVSFLVG